ncbi:hypothetical protein PR003_g34173 [Phytophthora rubi]|uniref:Secreted protein n=1 Tax=Phytophthora rubi TaxID=129364 RepID=A0A6A4ARF8_9STRA|nr:hypothetical protein PR003_g34173 [Phytophthora rubi]
MQCIMHCLLECLSVMLPPTDCCSSLSTVTDSRFIHVRINGDCLVRPPCRTSRGSSRYMYARSVFLLCAAFVPSGLKYTRGMHQSGTAVTLLNQLRSILTLSSSPDVFVSSS